MNYICRFMLLLSPVWIYVIGYITGANFVLVGRNLGWKPINKSRFFRYYFLEKGLYLSLYGEKDYSTVKMSIIVRIISLALIGIDIPFIIATFKYQILYWYILLFLLFVLLVIGPLYFTSSYYKNLLVYKKKKKKSHCSTGFGNSVAFFVLDANFCLSHI